MPRTGVKLILLAASLLVGWATARYLASSDAAPELAIAMDLDFKAVLAGRDSLTVREFLGDVRPALLYIAPSSDTTVPSSIALIARAACADSVVVRLLWADSGRQSRSSLRYPCDRAASDQNAWEGGVAHRIVLRWSARELPIALQLDSLDSVQFMASGPLAAAQYRAVMWRRPPAAAR